MISFINTPHIYQSIILILYNAVLLCNTYCVISCVIFKTKAVSSILNFLLFIISFTATLLLMGSYALLTHEASLDTRSEIILSTPVWAIVSLSVVLILLSCIGLVRIIMWRRTNVTLMSVKEGTDKLPIGLCYYTENGIPKLLNHKMNYLCLSIMGKPLLDAREFWQKLVEGDVFDKNIIVRNGENPIVRLAEGTVYLLDRKEILVNKERSFEITASDITEKFALSQQLSEYNEGLRQVNKRLEYYSETVSDIIREKEILAAKISIHDKLGKAQIATRRYIESGGTALDRETLLEIWRSNISLLRNEISAENEDSSLDELSKAADVLGIKLCVTGTLPIDDRRVMRLIMSGARECLTNAVKHAGANEMQIKIVDATNDFVIEYTNDGTAPDSDIAEGGGLKYLRRIVEDVGGNMTVLTESQFILRLTIPKRGNVTS